MAQNNIYILKMKLLLTAILISFLVFGCNERKKAVASGGDIHEYHIRVRPFGDGCEYWAVEFTNDNFITFENLNDTWDESGKFIGNSVVKQLYLANSEEKAVAFAKQFTTYQQCVSYNDTIELRYSRLREYRKAHPIEAENLTINQGKKCEPTTEIIVY